MVSGSFVVCRCRSGRRKRTSSRGTRGTGERFETRTGSRLGWAARDVLEYKWQYFDANLTEWSVDDVEALLFEILPAKVNLGPNDAGDLIAGFAAFLRFLSTEGLLSEGTGERLARRVEDAQGEFEAAMNDEERFSPGKRLVAEMIADGVDPTDQEAMDRWMTGFNERSFEERDRVLGPSLERRRRAVDAGAEPLTRLPPVVLAPEDVVREAARTAVNPRQVRDLVDFVGSGRKVTDLGNLTLADGKALVTVLGTSDTVEWQHGEARGSVRSSQNLREVDLVFRLAMAAGFLEQPSRERSPSVPRPGSSRASPSRRRAGCSRRRSSRSDWFTRPRQGPLRIGLVQGSRRGMTRSPGPLRGDRTPRYRRVHRRGLGGPPGSLRPRRRRGTQARDASTTDGVLGPPSVAPAAAAGVLEKSGIETVGRPWGGTDEFGGTVTLTPLGTWLVHRMLAAVADVPVAGSLAEVAADELLTREADLPDDIARVELEVWLQAHGDAAAALLVEALPGADETGRVIAFRALLDVGLPAAEAMRGWWATLS